MSVIGPRPGLWNQDILTAERDKYNANDVKPGHVERTKEEQELLMLYRKCTPSKRHLLKVYLQMLTQFQEKF